MVILTLYIVVKTTILRRWRELGTQKAVGFTTLRFMHQIALNMTPIIFLGVTVGAVAGCFVRNPLVAALMGGMGVAKMSLLVPIVQIILVCASIILPAYGVGI